MLYNIEHNNIEDDDIDSDIEELYNIVEQTIKPKKVIDQRSPY